MSGASAALARLAFSRLPSQAGPITMPPPEIKPAERNSRRVRGSGWSLYSNGSPRACGRGGFLPMIIAIAPGPDHCSVTAALPSTA